MNMSVVVNKLLAYRRRIEHSQALNREFGSLVGIELFDFIQGQPSLRFEVERRVEYFHRLAKEEDFIRLQDQLFERICLILKKIRIKDVTDVQKKWSGRA